jgi:type VI secretion system secreted protein Hcp
MSQTIHLALQIDGNDIVGESRITSLHRGNTIECLSYKYELLSPRDQRTGRIIGRRQHGPVSITKDVDSITPLLFKALTCNEPVNRAEFRFYRPNPSGDSREQHFYTVLLENGYITFVRQFSEEEFPKDGAPCRAMTEEVSFVFQTITWTCEVTGSTHSDTCYGNS